MITAHRLIDLAARLLQPHHRDWAEAMRAELAAIPPDEQFGFALGCLWAALLERIRLMKAFVILGRWGVGLVTTLYGAFFLYEFSSTVILLTSTRTNPFVSRFPYICIFALLMGLSHAGAGLSLILWRPRGFMACCTLALIPAIGLTLFGALNHLPRPESYAWPFEPLALLVAAAAFLWWLDRKPRRVAMT